MSVRAALVVGVNRFHSALKNLDHCVADAEAVEAVLGIDNYGFDVQTLVGPEATKAAITQALVEMVASRPDVICFYYAGHGVTDATGTYLATADGQPFDEGIDVSRLVAQLTAPQQDHGMDCFVILDCCNAGAASLPGSALTAARGATSDNLTDAFRRSPSPNSAVLGASLADQRARESDTLGHGVFTYHLLEGLMGGAADHNGNVSIGSLYDYVSAPFLTNTGQTPFTYAALAGGTPLGSGLVPRMGPPLEVDEIERLSALAQELADGHRRRRMSGEWDEWEDTGFRAAAQDLSGAVTWFQKQIARYPQLLQRKEFAAAWRNIQRYRADLGSINDGTRTPVGRAIERLGQGSFGTVWRVEEDDGSAVAYKAYHPNDLGDDAKSSRFRRGFEAMQRLDHPRVVKVSLYTDAPLGFTMDYVAGSDLRGLDPAASMEPVETVFLLSAVAEAISHAHDREVVHRDIKPENIVCSYDDELERWDPKLTDFDLAWISTGTQVTREAIGNLLYAAPEQFMNFSMRAVSGFKPTLDIFSFGQLAYFCTTGSDPSPTNEGQNRENFRRAVANWPSNDAAGHMIALYETATAFDARDRPGEMGVLLDELREIQSLLATPAGRELGVAQFLAELQFAFTGTPALEIEDTVRRLSFSSTSRQTDLVVAGRRVSGSANADFSVEMAANERVGWEGVPNGVLRARLNKRIEGVMSRHAGADWRAGQSGVYQVFLDLAGVSLDRDGLGYVRRVMTEALTKIESS
jgi:hypothetical protein